MRDKEIRFHFIGRTLYIGYEDITGHLNSLEVGYRSQGEDEAAAALKILRERLEATFNAAIKLGSGPRMRPIDPPPINEIASKPVVTNEEYARLKEAGRVRAK